MANRFCTITFEPEETNSGEQEVLEFRLLSPSLAEAAEMGQAMRRIGPDKVEKAKDGVMLTPEETITLGEAMEPMIGGLKFRVGSGKDEKKTLIQLPGYAVAEVFSAVNKQSDEQGKEATD